MELARNPAAEDAIALQSILSQELARVTELGQVMRSLAQPRAAIEAFSPADAAPDVVAILALHPAHREHAVVIDASRASPVRVVRWMFVRALVALAANGAASTGSSPRISVADDDDWVVARLDGATTPVADLSPYAAELARTMGGEPLRDAGFRVPSLAGLRRREGR
jgi:hypothetical protein